MNEDDRALARSEALSDSFDTVLQGVYQGLRPHLTQLLKDQFLAAQKVKLVEKALREVGDGPMALPTHRVYGLFLDTTSGPLPRLRWGGLRKHRYEGRLLGLFPPPGYVESSMGGAGAGEGVAPPPPPVPPALNEICDLPTMVLNFGDRPEALEFLAMIRHNYRRLPHMFHRPALYTTIDPETYIKSNSITRLPESIKIEVGAIGSGEYWYLKRLRPFEHAAPLYKLAKGQKKHVEGTIPPDTDLLSYLLTQVPLTAVRNETLLLELYNKAKRWLREEESKQGKDYVPILPHIVRATVLQAWQVTVLDDHVVSTLEAAKDRVAEYNSRLANALGKNDRPSSAASTRASSARK